MLHSIERLIADYGVIAVFLGCLAEGEGVAVVGGFFAREGLFPIMSGVIAAFFGTLAANTLLFAAGRYLSAKPFVQRMRGKPGFSHALELAERHPRSFIFLNRFVYGMRLISGTAAGLTTISWPLFMTWNVISAVVWAVLFVGLGYFFGLSVETLLGEALRTHQRLVVGLLLLAAAVIIAVVIARRVRRREARLEEES